MTSFCTIASGSAGNAALLSWNGVHLLIDIGISCRRLTAALRELGLGLQNLSGILITHEHTDHIAGLATCSKTCRAPIYCTPGTARQLQNRLGNAAPLLQSILQSIPMGQPQHIAGLTVTALPTSHDCGESAAFRVDTSDGSLGYLTDTGCIPHETARALLGTRLLVLESNHDVETLLSGPYPSSLKRRVVGPYGHLSNDAAARFAVQCAASGVQDIILAHLSRENNTPQMALNTVSQALEAVGYRGRLSVAPEKAMGEIHTWGTVLCSE